MVTVTALSLSWNSRGKVPIVAAYCRSSGLRPPCFSPDSFEASSRMPGVASAKKEWMFPTWMLRMPAAAGCRKAGLPVTLLRRAAHK